MLNLSGHDAHLARNTHQSLGIENLSRSQVSEMTKGLNEQVSEFRNRPLEGAVYPVLWVDALYEKVRVDGRIISMAILIVCGVDENGHRDIIAVEPMTEESRSSYVRLVITCLMEYAEDWSVSRAYLGQESIAATLTTAA